MNVVCALVCLRIDINVDEININPQNPMDQQSAENFSTIESAGFFKLFKQPFFRKKRRKLFNHKKKQADC